MTAAKGPCRIETLTVYGIELEILRCGLGRPLLLLHGMQTVHRDAPYLGLLAQHAEVIAPSSPGFGRSPRPADFRTIYDLVHLYLALITALPHSKISLLGLSFGGWIAAEIAACCSRIDRLILVDALGIKISDRETPDIFDVFNRSPIEVNQRSWHDPEKWSPDFDAMSDEQIMTYARNKEAACLYGWEPYMHNPQLTRWLRRIAIPTCVLWGASDGIVTPSYGRAYSELIPGARFSLIDRAGHHPEIECPEVFAEHVRTFLDAP
jgi:pimeloyl-ACP methyl ester carboxylesterase